MIVKFSYAEEFIEEMRKDPPPSGVVRRTVRQKSTEIGFLFEMSVVATYANARGEVVTLEERCGERHGYQEEKNSPTRAKIAEVTLQIEEAAAAAGLEVRSGVLEP